MIQRLLKSRAFHSWFGVIVSCVLIAWIALSVNWKEVTRELQRVNLLVLLGILFFTIFHYVLRAWRWRYLLPRGNQISLRELFDSLMVGNFASFVLPLRAGEFIRPFLLTRFNRETSFSTALVSVVVERFFDLSIVLATFAIVLGVVPGIPAWVNHGAAVLSLLAAVILLIMVVGTFAPQAVMKPVKLVTGLLPKSVCGPIEKFTADFLHGAGVLRRGGRLLAVMSLSLVVWATGYFSFQMYFWLFGENPSLWVSLTVGVIIALAVAAPSAPGFIGVYQTACIAAFELFGLSRELAVAYSIVSHLLQYALFVLYGMFVLMRLNLNLKDLQRGEQGQHL